MVIPTIGSVILVPFPFSDLSQSKLRPAVVLAEAGRNDWILCQITSNAYGDSKAIILSRESFQIGFLQVTSFARPGKLFTSNSTLMIKQIGILNQKALNIIIEEVINILRPGMEI